MSTATNPIDTKPKKGRAKEAKGPGPRSTSSPARVFANQQNSLRSKGPTSPGRKAVSRRNALKHGPCALVVDVPGEDPEMLQIRFDARRHELNPAGSTHGDYLVSVAVRRSLDLDRLNVARTADRVRSARTDRAEARSLDVEGLLGRLKEDCGTAARQLNLTTEGCQALIDEWEHLKAPLLRPPHRDEKDAYRLDRLQGRGRVARREAPDVAPVPTRWIERQRRAVEKLEANELGEAHDLRLRYDRDSDRGRADLPDIEAGARHGITGIRTMIEAEQRDSRERIGWLKETESREESEAMLRARLAPSDEGRLRRRYESEAERGLFKVMDLLRGGVKAGPRR